LQLGEHREHPEHGTALGGGGVDALLHHLQPDPTLTQLRAQSDQVQHGTPEPTNRVTTSTSPSRRIRSTRSSFGREALAPLA